MSSSKPTTFKHKAGTCPILSNDNYAQWKVGVSFILNAVDGLEIVLEKELRPAAPERPTAPALTAYELKLKDYKFRSAQAASIIYSSVSTGIHAYINTEQNPAAMWKILKNQLDSATARAALARLMRQFYKERFPPNGSIDTYIETILDYQNRLELTKYALNDEIVTTHILSTLPPSYNVIVQILNNQPELTKEDVLSSLRNFDTNEPQSATVEGTAMIAARRGETSKGYRKGGYKGKGKEEGLGRIHRQTPYTLKTTTCWYCGEDGHKQNDCKVKNKAQKVRESRFGTSSSEARLANVESSSAYATDSTSSPGGAGGFTSGGFTSSRLF